MSFPPVKTLATVPVTQEIALKFLSTYLSATSTTPYLLPGARLDPSGPTAGSSASPMIYNLQRVEAGLRGEWLAPVLDLQNADGEEGLGGGAVLGALGEGGADNMEAEGWQDLDEYQREQSVEVGEVGPRTVAVAQEGDKGFEERVEVDEAPKAKRVKTKRENGMVSKPVDRIEKKKAKKERLKEEKKMRRAAALRGDVPEE